MDHQDHIHVRHYQPLSALGVPLRVRQGQTHGETTYWSLEGVLGPFVIDYGRGYWIARGPMPLEVARELYAQPIGRDAVRVAGHCCCPPPEAPWITWRAPDGRQVVPLAEREKCVAWIGRLWKTEAELDASYLFSDDPTSAGAAFVESYHIDTEAGLILFVETIRRHRLDQPAAQKEAT